MKLGFAIALVVLCSLFSFHSLAQSKSYSVCISTDEMKLYDLIMKYRIEKGLPEIPLSKSLTYVAKTHVKDIEDNPADGDCNMHSWSSKGNWTACCYTSDHKKAECMWNKPTELTNFKGDGFEIAHGGRNGYVVSPNSALEGWKHSKSHNAVISNEGIWTDKKWKSIGIGMYNGFAVVWFGLENDPDGKPEQCKN